MSSNNLGASTIAPAAHRQLVEALTDPAPSALLALRYAAAWARETIEQAAASQDTQAIATVIALDEALTELHRLSGVVPALAVTARPGPAVEGYLLDRTAELDELAAAVAATRSALEAGQQTEAQLQQLVAEHADLRAQVSTLRRLERLADALGELEGQRQAIDDRLAAIAAPVTKAEQAVARGSKDLVRLTLERQAALDPEVRSVLRQAAAAQAALQAAEEQLHDQNEAVAAASARQKELVSLHQDRVTSLAAHAAADRAVADALAPLVNAEHAGGASTNGVSTANALLDDIQARLNAVDDALGRTLENHQTARKLPVVHWNAGSR